jgi:hypothetical protein
MASAGSITTSNGASCNDNYNLQETGPELSLNTSTDSYGNASVGIQYTIKLGGNKPTYSGSIQRIDCSQMLRVEQAKQNLELQRLQLEMKVLKAQLAAAKASNKPISTGDDW